FSQEGVIRSIHEAQEKQLQKQVDAGKMSKEQADRALSAMEQFTGPTMMKIFGSVGAVVVSFVFLFLTSLILWLLGSKFFKGGFGYIKTLEVVGLAGMITFLGTIIGMLLVVTTGNMAMTPGPVLLVQDFDQANRIHRLLSQINLVMIWYVA